MTSCAALMVVLLSCISWTAHGFFPSNRKGVTCANPAIENGDHTPHAWFTWRYDIFSVITVSCDEGYRLEGEAKARCMLNGQWSQMPRCVSSGPVVASRLRCELPPIGDNVDVSPMRSSYDPDETVTFACPGYRKAGGYKVCRCGYDGQFHPAPPKCIAPKCIPPEIPENGGISPNQHSYAVGEVASYKCAEGYRLVGAANTTCGEDGYFPYVEVKCEEVVKMGACSRPDTSSKQALYQDKESYKSGEKVTYFCAYGHKLRGKRVRQCLLTGEWSGSQPVCKKVFCIRPASPVNGRLFNDKKNYYSVGQSVRYLCDRGYELNGSSSLVCENNGNFRPKPPTCEPSRARSVSGYH